MQFSPAGPLGNGEQPGLDGIGQRHPLKKYWLIQALGLFQPGFHQVDHGLIDRVALALRQAQGIYEYKAVTRSSISSSSSATHATASGGRG